MQSEKDVIESMKESAANAAATARSALEKTKATVQEKVEKMSSHDPVEKEIAEEKKEERKPQAEIDKHEAHRHNAAAREAAKVGVSHPAGYSTGGHTDYPHTRTSGTYR